LRDAVEKLDETKNHRLGNLIGSQAEGDKVAALMEQAISMAASMVDEEVSPKS
jgi:hypothetical protein